MNDSKRARALNRQEQEPDAAYIARIRLSIITTVMLHLFREGHEQCPYSAAGALHQVEFDVHQNRVEARTVSQSTIALFPRRRGRLEIFVESIDFEERVCILGGAIVLALLEPEVLLEFSLPVDAEVVAQAPSIGYAARHGGLVQLSPHIRRIWTRDEV